MCQGAGVAEWHSTTHQLVWRSTARRGVRQRKRSERAIGREAQGERKRARETEQKGERGAYKYPIPARGSDHSLYMIAFSTIATARVCSSKSPNACVGTSETRVLEYQEITNTKSQSESGTDETDARTEYDPERPRPVAHEEHHDHDHEHDHDQDQDRRLETHSKQHPWASV